MAPATSRVRRTVVPVAPLLTRRIIWVVGISLANAAAAWLVATRVVQGAAGVGWDMLIPCASLATLILSLGGLWWATRRRPRLRTGLGVGLAIGLLVHPVMWYLLLLASSVSGTGSSLGDAPLTLAEAPAAGLMYAAISLFLTGWLSCPISAAICGAGLALYARRAPAPIRCFSCGADWSYGTFSRDCRECGGGALKHACLFCGGQCGQVWNRAIIDSHDEHESHWVGICARMSRRR